jgi:hypothetical protein
MIDMEADIVRLDADIEAYKVRLEAKRAGQRVPGSVLVRRAEDRRTRAATEVTFGQADEIREFDVHWCEDRRRGVRERARAVDFFSDDVGDVRAADAQTRAAPEAYAVHDTGEVADVHSDGPSMRRRQLVAGWNAENITEESRKRGDGCAR